MRLVVPAESALDLPVGGFVVAADAVGGDVVQDAGTVPGARGDPGGIGGDVQPQGRRCVP
jgi:hypothetical protein